MAKAATWQDGLASRITESKSHVDIYPTKHFTVKEPQKPSIGASRPAIPILRPLIEGDRLDLWDKATDFEAQKIVKESVGF